MICFEISTYSNLFIKNNDKFSTKYYFSNACVNLWCLLVITIISFNINIWKKVVLHAEAYSVGQRFRRFRVGVALAPLASDIPRLWFVCYDMLCYDFLRQKQKIKYKFRIKLVSGGREILPPSDKSHAMPLLTWMGYSDNLPPCVRLRVLVYMSLATSSMLIMILSSTNPSNNLFIQLQGLALTTSQLEIRRSSTL